MEELDGGHFVHDFSRESSTLLGIELTHEAEDALNAGPSRRNVMQQQSHSSQTRACVVVQ